MDSQAGSYLDRFARRVCMVLPEYRGPRLSYPCGALAIGLLLSECAGMTAQEAKADWFEDHWHLVKEVWHRAGGMRVTNEGTPSQPTISRMLNTFSEETFARLVYADERKQLRHEWEAYLQRCEDEAADPKKSVLSRPSRGPSIASTEKPAKAVRAKKRDETRST